MLLRKHRYDHEKAMIAQCKSCMIDGSLVLVKSTNAFAVCVEDKGKTVKIELLPTTKRRQQIEVDLSLLKLVCLCKSEEIDKALFVSCFKHLLVYAKPWDFFLEIVQGFKSTLLQAMVSEAAHRSVYKHVASLKLTKAPLHPDRVQRVLHRCKINKQSKEQAVKFVTKLFQETHKN